MKSIVFDTGSLISLTLNDLLWTLEPLKEKYKGSFLIPSRVKYELIDKPLNSKKYKFEAIRVLTYINKKVIQLVEDEKVKEKALMLLDLANHTFKTQNTWLEIVHLAEMEGIACAIEMNSDAFVVDERTCRTLIEDSKSLANILSHKLHANIIIDNDNLKKFLKEVDGVKMIRSVEIAIIAYEAGILDVYLPNIPKPKFNLLESVLWGVKLNGCAVSEREIKDILSLEFKT